MNTPDLPTTSAGHWVSEPKPPSFAMRMDEAAAVLRPVAGIKVLLALLGGLMASLILPWTVCVVWVLGVLALELWCWFATHPPPPGEAVGRGARINFVCNYVTQNAWWLTLGVLLWRSGSVEGEMTGAVVILSISSVGLLLFYTSPAVFLAVGFAPPLGALAVMVLNGGADVKQLLPLGMALALSAFFSLGRALETPSVQAQQRQINHSLSRYQILAENVTDIISRTDVAGALQYASPAVATVLGYRPEEMLGSLQADHVHPDDREIMAAALPRMLAEPTRSQTVTTRALHKDGHWIWLQTSMKLVCEDGVPVGVIGVSRDVTERVAVEAALLEAKAEAESATLAKAEFLANISHEIRTPMNGILGALHLLEREPISAEGRELMRQANDCGRMLSQLLNDVLDFSKIDAGQLDLAPEPMDVGEALEAVTALLRGQAQSKGIALRCEISGSALWIEADPVRLRQAMFNLVGNAVKFTAQGHVTARLTVENGEGGRRRLRLEVEDTGIGMTADAQSHMFERFRQAESDTARRYGGTGLGLAITQALARMMGGEIGFSSVEGQGSTFWLDFEAPACRPVVVEAAEAGLLDGVAILLVEDNPTNRLMARTLLTRLGASVEEAFDGIAGLAAARTGAHDLILMDVQMPHMDGVECTRAIRGLAGPAARVPIIGLTANVMVHQRAQYLAAGMDGVVAKPISPAALLGEIGRLMAQGDVEDVSDEVRASA